MAPLAVPVLSFSDDVLPVAQRVPLRRRSAAVAAIVAMVAALPAIFAATPALAANPDHVSFTLEGCRNDGTITLPIAGKYVCPDPAYTTGNLGKGWNELDRVPFRVTAAAGNSAPSVQTYTFAVALDAEDAGHPGYDRLSAPVFNSALSSATGCDTAPTIGAETIMSPGLGGISKTRFRTVTITGQAAGATCVYDFDGRLAIGSHLFPGASLHANLGLPVDATTITTSGIGARDVSIPVKEIAPQELSKTETASQGSSHTWAISKEASPTTWNFGDTCAAGATLEKNVTVTIRYHRLTADPSGPVTLVAVVTATNPASRALVVNVTDRMYDTATAPTLDTSGNPTSGTPIDVGTASGVTIGANSSGVVLTHTFSYTGTATAFSDRAVATYTTNDTPPEVIPGFTQAVQENVAVQHPTPAGNDTATIDDVESLVKSASDSSAPANMQFKVTGVTGTGSSGGFFTGYTLGNWTTGPVEWTSASQSNDTERTVVFAKTVRLTQAAITSGLLTDTATLTGNGGFTTSASASTSFSSTATVTLDITKTIPNVLTGTETATFNFVVTGPPQTPGGSNYSNNVAITMSATDTLNTNTGRREKTTHVTGLVPGTYTVTEQADPNHKWATQPPVNVPIALPSCSGGTTINNGFGPATAKAIKVTAPTTVSVAGWEFKLYSVGSSSDTLLETKSTGTNGEAAFTTTLQDGVTYKILETAANQNNFDTTLTAGDISGGLCQFTVNYPNDADRVFSCTFTNTQRGHVTVTKTVSGQPIPTGSTDSFEFSLSTVSTHQYANATNHGSLDFGYLPPGNYTLCELNLGPGWSSTWSYNGSTVTPTNPDSPQDLGNRCYTFSLAAGGTAAFAIDNTPPPGGGQRTIGYWRNWNTVKHTQDFLDAHPDNAYVDQFVPSVINTLGGFSVPDVTTAVAILSNASTKYAEHGLAAQLLAAELNVAAGAAPSCTNITSWITRGNTLLSSIPWNLNSTIVKSGYSGTYTRADFLAAHAVLDAYNNGTCPAAPFV